MYETIEDVLVTLHTGQWFGFDGDKVKMYNSIEDFREARSNV